MAEQHSNIPILKDAEGEQEQSLYAVHQKIYPRAVSGIFNYWRVGLVLFTQIIFYGLPWLTWNDRQAVLFDLGARKFYLFDWVFWPQDFVWLAAILIISALALVPVYGCGWPLVVRLCLSADGLYAVVHLDRTLV